MISTIASIAAGGAIGAVMRHGVNVAAVKMFGHGFPWGTLGVNVLGSFIMGALVVVFAHIWQPSPAVKVFFITGLLGAFTTFSTFSLDISTLWERGDVMNAAFYVLGSLILSVGALFAAMAITRMVVS